MATPENLWAEYVPMVLVQPWMVVEDAGERLAWFYEGLTQNGYYSALVEIWVRPTFWWLSFMLAQSGLGCVWRFGAIITPPMGGPRATDLPVRSGRRGTRGNRRSKGIPTGICEQPLFWIGFSYSCIHCAVVYR